MKTIALLLVATLAGSLGVDLQSQVPNTRMLRRVISKYKGHEYEMIVTERDVLLTPAWPSAAESPPLPARKAILAARSKLESEFPEAAGWRLLRVALDATSVDDRWIYVLTFDPTPPDAFEKLWPAFEAVVLMDGKALDVRDLK